jgi:hypothetical protein
MTFQRQVTVRINDVYNLVTNKIFVRSPRTIHVTFEQIQNFNKRPIEPRTNTDP